MQFIGSVIIRCGILNLRVMRGNFCCSRLVVATICRPELTSAGVYHCPLLARSGILIATIL